MSKSQVPNKQNKLNIANAELIFRNFSGEESKYNPAGKRNFCVFLDQPTAEMLQELGWNIRWSKPRDPDDTSRPYVQVTVSYKNYPPRIVMITGKKKELIPEERVHILDWAEIENVDLTIRPYSWLVNNKGGVKAYLNSMYVTIVEDAFEAKYSDIPYADQAQEFIEDDEIDLPFDLD